MIGHDVNFAVSRSVWNAFFNDPRFLPSLIQQELVDAGFYGRKSGRGFYDYREGAERPQPKSAVAQPVPGDRAPRPFAGRRSHRRPALRAGVAYTWGESSDGRIAEVGDAVVFQTDGRSATQRAAETGIANTVLIDLALDYTTQASRLAGGERRPSCFAPAAARRHRPAAGRRSLPCRALPTCPGWR
jgi:3-hydroxybutyryl-CoA dehydrogenase